ncbi:MAG: DNA polymerase III subunit gamma/tau, partial [Nitrospirae bacterium]
MAFGGKRVEADQLMILLGAVPHQLLRGVLEAVLARDAAGALKALAAVQDHGCDVRQFCGELMEHVRNLLV